MLARVTVTDLDTQVSSARGLYGGRSWFAYYWGGHRLVRKVCVDEAAWSDAPGGFPSWWARRRIARAVEHRLMMDDLQRLQAEAVR